MWKQCRAGEKNASSFESRHAFISKLFHCVLVAKIRICMRKLWWSSCIYQEMRTSVVEKSLFVAKGWGVYNADSRTCNATCGSKWPLTWRRPSVRIQSRFGTAIRREDVVAVWEILQRRMFCEVQELCEDQQIPLELACIDFSELKRSGIVTVWTIMNKCSSLAFSGYLLFIRHFRGCEWSVEHYPDLLKCQIWCFTCGGLLMVCVF